MGQWDRLKHVKMVYGKAKNIHFGREAELINLPQST